MFTQIIAIGDIEKVKEIIGENIFVENGTVVLASVLLSEAQSIIKNLNKLGISSYTFKQYQKIISTDPKYTPLPEIDLNTAFDWLKMGIEFAGITYSNAFELFSVDRKDIKAISKVDPITKSIFSNSGALIAFIRANTLSIHANDDLDLLYEYKASSQINNIEFSPSDKHIAVSSQGIIKIIDIFKGEELLDLEEQEFSFFKSSIWLSTRRKAYSLENASEIVIDGDMEKVSKLLACGNKLAKFLDGKLQKIVFNNSGIETVKNQSNIKKIQFKFSENKLYSFITKNLNNKEQHIVESYYNKEITINNLDSCPMEVAVADGYFVVYDEAKNLSFFQKEKYGYVKVKSIRKDREVIISNKNRITVVYDTSSENVEFYDGCELRSVYTHSNCNGIEWSTSGLYVCTFTRTEDLGGLVQIFNCDGQLLLKKVFGKLTEFKWRPFIAVSESEKAKILSEHPISNEELEGIETTDDVSALLSEWKGYLLSKIQSITNN